MFHPKYQIYYFGLSDVGLVRDHNEDVWAAYPECGLFLLADGMGGHAAGEVAADQSVSYLYDLVKQWHGREKISLDQAIVFFRESLVRVNASIYQKSQTDSSLNGMGTTLCALYFFQLHVIITHVGDSRIYRIRKKKLQQLTEDHSLAVELASLGAMKANESKSFPYKHILTRAVGTRPTVEPTVNYLSFEPNDYFLICSDGLTNYITDPEIETILNTDSLLKDCAHELIDLANRNGGGDNITLLLVKIVNDDLPR